MKINRNNYEIFFIDYFEGTLNESQVAELFLFLEQNYDLKEEFESFENISLKADASIKFDNKENLKKLVIIAVDSINESNYQEYFIAYLENDLDVRSSENVELFLEKNIFLKKEYELFRKTFMKPDVKTVFDDKNVLKKSVVRPVSEINENNYQEYFIARLEGDLNLQESRELDLFLQNNLSLQKEFDLFRKTLLVPDKSIVYEEKQALKKYVIPVYSKRYIYTAVSVAASILIFVGIYFLNKPATNNNIAENGNNTHQGKTTQTKIERVQHVNAAKRYDKVNIEKGTAIQHEEKVFVKQERNMLKPVESRPIDQLACNYNAFDNKITVERAQYSVPVYTNQNLAEETDQLAQASEQGKVYTVKEYLLSRFRKKVTETEEQQLPADKLTREDLLALGKESYKKVTGKNADFDVSFNEQGKINCLSIGKNFSFCKK